MDINGHKMDINGHKIDINGHKMDINGHKMGIEGVSRHSRALLMFVKRPRDATNVVLALVESTTRVQK